MPGAKGRAAIPRLVIRRAARFGAKLGFDEPFLATIADAVIDVMGEHYSELVDQAENIKRVITIEEERFHRTMERGLNELDDMLSELDEDGVLSGEQAFYLKATLGLPIQVTKDIAEERGYTIDEAGYEAAEAEHARISGGGQAMGEIESGELYRQLLKDLQANGQLGESGIIYNPYVDDTASTSILALIQDSSPVDNALVGDKVEVVLGETHFYVESGGQVSDTGTITGDGWIIEVEDMKKPINGIIVHIGEVVEGNPKVGDNVTAQVDLSRRDSITRNHTATHLLHAALRNNLGTHVQQKGSLVAPDRLRFDFSHHEKVTDEELAVIQTEINNAILTNFTVHDEQKSLEQARKEGAMALFGEKYGDTVRTVIIETDDNRYSYELCGGIHVGETAEIGSFIFTGEGSVSAGIRRIEALTGQAAAEYIQGKMQTLEMIATQLGTTQDLAVNKVIALQDELSANRRQIENLQRKLAKFNFDEMIDSQLESINGKQALAVTIRRGTNGYHARND